MKTDRITWSKFVDSVTIHLANTGEIVKISWHFGVSQTRLFKWKNKLETLVGFALGNSHPIFVSHWK